MQRKKRNNWYQLNKWYPCTLSVCENFTAKISFFFCRSDKYRILLLERRAVVIHHNSIVYSMHHNFHSSIDCLQASWEWKFLCVNRVALFISFDKYKLAMMKFPIVQMICIEIIIDHWFLQQFRWAPNELAQIVSIYNFINMLVQSLLFI